MRWLPQSLLNRIFLLISVATMLFVASGMSMFYRAEFVQQIDDAQNSASMLMEVAAQAIEESAVIGDYDTVKRTLAKILSSPTFRVAQFIDMSGSVIRVEQGGMHVASAPGWLRDLIADRIYDVNRNIAVGGKDYGVIRLSFDIDLIANSLWRLMRDSALLAGIFMLASLLLIRTFLKHWLGNLSRLQSYQTKVLSGEIDAQASTRADAPAEIREAFEVVNRTAASLREQFGQRIDSLMNALIQHKKAMDEAAIVAELDIHGWITYVNERFVKASGQTREDLLNQALDAVGDPNVPDAWRWTPHNHVCQDEIRTWYRDGRSGWYQRTIVPIMDHEGRVEKYICIDIDISARKRSEQATASHATRQSLIAQFGKDVLNSDNPEILWKKAVDIAVLGLPADNCAGIGMDWETGQARLIDGTGWFTHCAGAEITHAGTPAWGLLGTGESRIFDGPSCKEVRDAWDLPADATIESGIHVPVSSGNRHQGVFAVYYGHKREFTIDEVNFLRSVANTLSAAIEAQEATARLAYMAEFDTLTDLPNRARLMTGLNEVLAHANRHGLKAGVMFVDLDRFKIVNDTFGHSVGDLLLVQASRRLCESVRTGDLVARLGGDEFAVILGDLVQRDDANVIAHKIIKALEQPFELNGQQVYVSASVGIAIYPDDGKNADYLIQCADTAMYGAKRAGRNAYQVYQPQMSEEVLGRMRLEMRLREALPRKELHLYYQPKVSLESGEISGFEALLRWHPVGCEMVMPDKFIPVMEETGMIVPVGEWVVRTVCEQLVAWQDCGVPMRTIAINLSARQFQLPDMVARIGAIINTSGIDPSLLEFELTESMLMVDPEAVAVTLQQLKLLGVRLSIDDFGTGYSSLAYLKSFPLDKLKIDRAFVHDVSGNADDAAITLAIISLAHNLNLTVVAEGVETSEQLNLLMANGCDEMQGFYFSRPVKGEECVQMLKQDKKLSLESQQKKVA
jgi:diguanylate cyclase (GGDEF)-like protein/PAS domain S-box-containing protein